MLWPVFWVLFSQCSVDRILLLTKFLMHPSPLGFWTYLDPVGVKIALFWFLCSLNLAIFSRGGGCWGLNFGLFFKFSGQYLKNYDN